MRANATAMPVRELDALGVLGREHERQERVVARLGRQQAVVPEVLELLRPRADVAERRPP